MLALVAGLGFALTGCPRAGLPDDAACPTGGTGSLAVTFSFPSVTYVTLDGPSVRAYGPDGDLAWTFRSTETTELPSGTYTLEMRRGITGPDPIVGRAYGVAEETVRTVCVPDGGEATLSVTMSEQPGSNRLWVTDRDTLVGISASDLASGGTATPRVLDGSLINSFNGFDFDRMGNLWAVTAPTFDTRILWLEPAALGVSGVLSPGGSITSSYFEPEYAPVSDLFIGRDDTLWLAVRRVDDTFNGLIGYSRATLAEALLSGGDLVREPDYVHELPGVTGPVAGAHGPSSALFLADFEGDAIHRIDVLDGDGSGVDATFTVRVLGSVTRAARGPRDIVGRNNGLGVLFETTGELVSLNGALVGTTPSAQIDVGSTTEFGTGQLPRGLEQSDGYWAGDRSSSAPGILRFDVGMPTSLALTSAAIDNPADLRFNPPVR